MFLLKNHFLLYKYQINCKVFINLLKYTMTNVSAVMAAIWGCFIKRETRYAIVRDTVCRSESVSGPAMLVLYSRFS